MLSGEREKLRIRESSRKPKWFWLPLPLYSSWWACMPALLAADACSLKQACLTLQMFIFVYWAVHRPEGSPADQLLED